ncbi:MAG: HD domain-containing protein [Candidatus Omnitrophica bacterium]|nr:HD domain-containing protein [Candidatus Omnitrophota bacterium]MDD5573868.1 HD domain-containing protein [Candidatus Omnitrophota bacterium]
MSTKNYLTLTKKYKALISALHSIYRLINTTYDLTDLASRLTKLLSQIFKADHSTFVLLTASKNHKRIATRCSIDNNKRQVSNKKTPVKSGLEVKIVSTSSAIKKDDILAVPLISDDIIGYIIIRRNKTTVKKEGGFDYFDLETLMTLAGQIVMAIKNLQLYLEQERMVMGTIKSLVTVLDSKVPPAYAHTPYFSRLVKTLAEEMRLNRKEVDSLKYASMLHDAGKVNIPTEILTKTSHLTGEEYDIVKRHPIKSAEIIKHVQILKPVIPIILHHHEKFDGTGYPSHLKKSQIPVGARIMSVADAFDAMVYGRPYRERVSVRDALDEIRKHTGTQFDPNIVKCLIKIFHNKKLKKYLNLTQ